MRIAIFSDVHGNYLNLLSFFESIESLHVDQCICLGDLCDYYPDSAKVIDLMREKQIFCLLGNHDELYISDNTLNEGKKEAYNFDEVLQKDVNRLQYLKTLPLSHEMKVGNKTLFFCHASPKDLLYTYIFPNTDLNIYNHVPYDYIFMGHTHRAFLKTHQNKVFCNVGSVGLPRDNGALLSFAILDTDDMSIQLYRKEIAINQVKMQYQSSTPDQVIGMLDRQEILNHQYIQL
jgi:putative phosphoesterase